MKTSRPQPDRRTFLAFAAPRAGCLAATGAQSKPAAKDRRVSVSEAFEREVTRLWRRATCRRRAGRVKDRRLVYARATLGGSGQADSGEGGFVVPHRQRVQADHGRGGDALVEQQKLSLDAAAFDIVKLKPALDGDKKPDPRLAVITIRQLLQHTGGWDRDKSFDPMFRATEIARAVGEPAPAGPSA